MAMFEYQLARAVYDGTAAGGVKWWFHKRFEPQGSQRQHSFDLSVVFVCKHARKHYIKRVTNDSRKSKHQACVECPAFVRFKGSIATEMTSTAVVISAKFKQPVSDPLKVLRKEFPALNQCILSEILSSTKFAFVFTTSCLAEDALLLSGQTHAIPSMYVSELRSDTRSSGYGCKWNDTHGHHQPLDQTRSAWNDHPTQS
jgi:hypothetical protein